MIRRSYLAVFAILLTMLIMPVQSGSAAGATVYVDDNWAGTPVGSDPDGGGPATSFGTDAFATVQDGINGATPGDIVEVRPGTYASFTMNKWIIVDGAGTGNNPAVDTIISDAGATIRVLVTASGSSAADPSILSDVRVVGTSINTGDGITLNNVSFITIDNVISTTHRRALEFINVSDIVITDSVFVASTNGLHVGNTASVNRLTIDGSAFNGNIRGWLVTQATTPTDFDDITVTNSQFSGNTQKGLYTEKLSNAVFQNLTVLNSGIDPAYGFNNGIDINLKYDNYSNIAIFDSLFAGSGINGPLVLGLDYQAGLAVKARQDAPAYNTFPATLTDVRIEGNNIYSNRTGIRFGEPAKNNPGPANITLAFNRIINNTVTGIDNATTNPLNAEYNWFGANGSSFPNPFVSLGDVDRSPTLVLSSYSYPIWTCNAPDYTTASTTWEVTLLWALDGSPSPILLEPEHMFDVDVTLVPSVGSINPPSPVFMVDGLMQTTYTVPENGTAGIQVWVDNVSIATGAVSPVPNCEPPIAPQITSTNTTTFYEGVPNSFMVTATGDPAPTLSITGALPTGVSFNSGTGEFSGVPAPNSAGSYPLTITASNGTIPDATQNFTLIVEKAAIVAEPVGNGSCTKIDSIVNMKLRGMVPGRQYTYTLEVRDATTVYMIRQFTSTFTGPVGTQINFKWLIFPYDNMPALDAPQAYNPSWMSLPASVSLRVTAVDRTTNLMTQTTMSYACASGAVSAPTPNFTPNVTGAPYAP